MVAVLVSSASAGAAAFPRGQARIDTGPRTVTFEVELALTDAQRQQGLMLRRTLRPNAGMAFVWTRTTQGGFWMKNTLIPLSIAFYGADGTILRILDMAPCREEPCRIYDPGTSYRGALEVNRGAFRRLGVSVGDVIRIRR